MSININVGNVKKKVKDVFINKDGAKKKVKSIWVNKNNVASKVYSSALNKITNGFVAVSDYGEIFHTKKGLNWEKIVTINPDSNLEGIAYGNNLFVVLAKSIKNSDLSFSYYSTDGINWKVSNTKFKNMQRSITYGNGMFVSVGNGSSFCYSTDGNNWTEGLLTSGAKTFMMDVIYGGYGTSRFVCVGLSGQSYTSTNGKVWTPMTGLPTNADMWRAVYEPLRAMFYCVGDDGAAYSTVTKGISWTNKMTGIPTSIDVRAIACANNGPICVGDDNTGVMFAYMEAQGKWTSCDVPRGSYGTPTSAVGSSNWDAFEAYSYVSVGGQGLYNSSGRYFWDKCTGALASRANHVIYVDIPS